MEPIIHGAPISCVIGAPGTATLSSSYYAVGGRIKPSRHWQIHSTRSCVVVRSHSDFKCIRPISAN